MAPISSSSSIYYFTNSYFYDYICLVLYILVQCLVPAESNAHLPVSYLVLPFLAATQEIHHSTYITSHIVDHNALKSL